MENENTASSTTSNYRLPSDLTMQHITKIGIVNDKPIMSIHEESKDKVDSLVA